MAHGNEARCFLAKAPVILKWKLRVFDAVIHSKVLYGMETLVISQSDYDKFDVFQVRIFRKILNIKHCFWSHVTNDTVMNTANTRAQNIDKLSKSFYDQLNTNKELSNPMDISSEVTQTQTRCELYP